LLACQALEDVQQLVGSRVDRVIEADFVCLATFFIPKRFLAQVGDAPVNIKVKVPEVMELRREGENPLHQWTADLERLRARFFVELANVVRSVANLIDSNLDKLGEAGLKHLAEGDCGCVPRPRVRRKESQKGGGNQERSAS
jgi:hypothetical protein